jgi:phosphatidylinositol-3-phosphatase
LRRFVAAALCAALFLTTDPAPAGTPPIQHVFVIVLENQDYATTFGPDSAAPYLSRDLVAQGALLRQYYGTTHFSLGNYIAMISGQSGTPETRNDCEIFADFKLRGMTADGQAIGRGCVYPARVQTLGNQLTAAGRTWRAYMEDMGNDPTRAARRCGHPPLNAKDPTQSAAGPSAAVPGGDQYAVRHNPFMYFHSVIDSADCAERVVRLEELAADLRSAATTAAFSFIAPNLCHDGHDAPCKTGEPGGLVSADAFLRQWVPMIVDSPAYREGGLLVITFDEGETPEKPDGHGGIVISAEGATCCHQQPGPNVGHFPQTVRDGKYLETFRSFGGDRTGAVLLSPFLKPGTVSDVPFNHYALLRSLEDLLVGGRYLGYAGAPGLVGFFDGPAAGLEFRSGPVAASGAAPGR